MAKLSARFVRPEKSYKTNQGVPLKVVLTNTGKEDISVLVWNTPLDGLVTDCLHVRVKGKKVPYDGPIIKRAAPTAEDYITIKAGKSVEGEFMVSDGYNTSLPGTYNVKLKNPVPDVVPKSAKLRTAMKAGAHVRKPVPIKSATSFKVEKGPGKRLTLGEQARNQESATKKRGPAKAMKKKAAAKGVVTPATKGGTSAKKKAAVKAHTDGYKLCLQALGELANDAHYVEWFGKHHATRFKKVKSHYSAVKTLMQTTQFTYNLTGAGCDSGVYAYTYKGTTTIWFCSEFWSATATGTDSRAGTVVHEHTHSDASTDDIRYGQADCRSLAKTKPNDAIQNADSHEYYAGG